MPDVTNLLKAAGLLVVGALLAAAFYLVRHVQREGTVPSPEIAVRRLAGDLPRVVVERIRTDRPADEGSAAPVEAPVREVGPLDRDLAEAFPGALTAHDAETLRRLYELGTARRTAGNATAALAAFEEIVRADPQSPIAQRAYVEIGGILLAQGDAAGAIERLGPALTLRPDDAVALHNRGLAHLRTGRLEEARADLERAARLDAGNAATLLALGNVYHALGWYDSAIQAFRRSVEIDSATLAVHYNLGLALWRAGRLPEAAEAFRAAADRATGRAAAAAHALHGTVLFERGLFEEAARAYDAAATLEPDTWFHHYNKGVALSKTDPTGDLALAAFGQALGRAPGDPRILFNVGAIRFARGEWREAAEAYAKGLERAPDDPAARLALGFALQRLGRTGEAEAAYRRVAAADVPEATAARLHLGTILEGRGETDAAIQAYRGGPADDPLTHYNAGRLLVETGRLDEAVPLLARAADLGPDEPRFALEHARAAERAGALGVALTSYRRALERGADEAPTRLRIGILLARQQRAAEAEAELRLCLAANPSAEVRAIALINLGALLGTAGRTDEAIGVYREAVAADPARPATYYNLGLLYLRAQRYDRAVEALRTAERLRPDAALAAKVQTALGNVFQARGLVDEAARAYEAAVRLDRTLIEAQFNLRALRGETPAAG